MSNTKCDFCKEAVAYSGKTTMGSHAHMCTMHYLKYGTLDCTVVAAQVQQRVSLKTCKECGAVKPITEFYEYTDGAGVTRHRNECKTCNLAMRKKAAFYRVRKGHS